jgi:hypothetical protein
MFSAVIVICRVCGAQAGCSTNSTNLNFYNSQTTQIYLLAFNLNIGRYYKHCLVCEILESIREGKETST